MLGWFNGGGIVWIPDGGARFIAGGVWTSGTAAGGTGGGRSENICADTGAGSSAVSAKATPKANASPGTGHPPRPNPTMPLPPEIMAMLFTENAANSSLHASRRSPIVAEPEPAPNVNAAVAVQSHSLPRPLGTGINHAFGSEWMILALPRRGGYR